MVSQKRKDISYPDMGCKHGKPAEAFSFHLFLKHIIQSNAEPNHLAVMRRPEDGSFLLEQIKNWIANKSSGFNARKIISSLRQEPIYRSPGAGQQMGVTRYSISIYIEDRDAFYQGASNSQMLLWDAHAPPPKRVTSGGDWYVVSMEVFVEKIDLGGRRLDNRNPEVHVKVTLHVANARRAWTPPDFSPCDPHLQAETFMYNNALNPCVLNYHADDTLSPEEFCQLFGPQKYFFPTEQQKDSIPTLNPCVLKGHANDTLSPEEFCQLVGPQNYFLPTKQPKDPIPTLNPCFLKHHADNTLSPEEFCQLVGPQKFFLRNEQPKDPIQKDSILDPGPPKLNHAIHADHRNLNLSRWSHYKSGDGALSRLKAGCILVLLASTVAASSVPQSNQVKIKVFQDPNKLNTFNCTLKMDEYTKSYGHCGQTETFDATVPNEVEGFLKRLQKTMNANQESLKASHNSSGTLQLNLIWNCKDLNETNVTIQYTFNGNELTEEEIAHLPLLISDPKNDHSLNSSMLMEKEKYYVKKQWESIRKLLPSPEKSYLPETTEPWVIAVLTVISVSIILVISIISIVLCRKYGMMSCKKVQETICKAAYRLVAQTEAHVSPNGMEAPEREDDMTNSV